MDELDYWLALNLIPGMGPRLFKRLLDHFGSPRAVLSAPASELEQLPGMGKKVSAALAASWVGERLQREKSGIQQLGLRVLTLVDETYPPLLRHIFDPPPVLYIKGELLPQDRVAIAIVGSRHPSHYGLMAAERLTSSLAQAGFSVVSGLARGIDSIAHRCTIAAGGRTLAVFGCGLDRTYPSENRALREEIVRHGAILSEFPLGTRPEPINFPRRNRVISGLALGTLVVEAAAKSGSLITAEYALEQGREVFAVPGQITSEQSRGTHRLLRGGATLVETAEDVIAQLPAELHPFLTFTPPGRTGETGLPEAGQCTEQEQVVLAEVQAYELHIDAITERSGLQPCLVAGILMNLELKGLVRQFPGNMFVRA